MAENRSLLEKKNFPITPTRRSGLQRIRKPNSRIFGDDVVELPTTPKSRKHMRLDSTPKSTLKSHDRKVSQIVGNKLKNLLKLPKAQLWVYYEWFYSNIDKAMFEGENDFGICLKESFPQLKTRTLTRIQWRIIRRLMGKPRRCSAAFFEEERSALACKRQKIRLLQQRKTTDNIDHIDLRDLPDEIPRSLVVGTKVTATLNLTTARLRRPQNGLFTGVIDAIDTSNSAYRVTFDKEGLGTHTVPDIDVLSNDSYETLPLSSFKNRVKRPPRQMFPTPPRHSSAINSPGLENDPLLGSTPSKGPSLEIEGNTLGGFPVKFLINVTKVTKLLGIKKKMLQDMKTLNTDAERLKCQGKDFDVPFQQKYAKLLLDFDLVNKKIKDYFSGIIQTWKEVDPDQAVALFNQTIEIKKKCQLEAESIVQNTNISQNGEQRIKDGKNLKLICNLLSLLLQIRTFADSEMHSFEFKSLQESLDAIKSQINPSNLSVFQNSIEIHMNHIQSGLTQAGNLHAFTASSSTSL
ncbi:hypothetical protein HELRODRAFT_167921 [Helobdella robusta]|uniref:DIRP domain-containing protein n=1 Tax=Helobdella robusta TaxID=6412 RepID=T1EZY7_HELRO|nr:hypothetical protein HELRODRAFT_167921 [Helobdella robusta]ESO10074.1 hypothetical protein HELRODRAFT_167921 [Helobdella robusta]